MKLFAAFPATLAGKVLAVSFYGAVTAPTSGVRTDTTAALDTAMVRITTDTGDFAPGRTSFTRYTTPQLCMAAARQTRLVAWRSVDAQMLSEQLRKTPLHDTLPASAVDMAHRCAANFSVTTISPRDLPDLLPLALAANHDSMAAQIVTRQLSLAASASGRDSILSAAIYDYSTAKPARLATATALIDRVAETGDARRRWQLGELDNFLKLSQQAWDTAAVTRFATRIIDTINATPRTQRAKLALFVTDAYQALASQAYLQSPDLLRPLAQRARQTWHDFATPLDTVDLQLMQWDAKQSASVDDYVRWLLPVPGMENTAGVVYPALKASHWFPGEPVTGVSRLIISFEAELRSGCTGDFEILYTPMQYCWPFYERIRRLATQYGPTLQIVLVAATRGAVVLGLPMSPQQEAERLKWYFLDYLKLPVTLAVIDRPVRTLPAPDGRQWRRKICDPRDPDADMSAIACQYLLPDAVLLNGKGEGVPLWGPDAQQDLIIGNQVSQ